MATSLGSVILSRVLQGLAGGGLQPSSQAVLLDAFPPEKQGGAMTIFGDGGPARAGRRSDARAARSRTTIRWRWIFFINVPVGLLALAACYARWSGSGLSRQVERAGVEEAAVPFRLDRPIAAGRHDGLLGGDAEQGAGVGLARRSVLARADAGGLVRRWA